MAHLQKQHALRLPKCKPQVLFPVQALPASWRCGNIQPFSDVSRLRGHLVHATTTSSSTTKTNVSSTYVSREARQALFGKATEQRTEVEAVVQGNLPAWLCGSLIANGGGDYSNMVHMFDGIALLSKLRVEGGRVFASQQFVQSEQYKSISRTGRMKWREFATPLPADTWIQKASQIAENVFALATNGPGFTDNASVNAVPLPDGTVMACSETISSVYRVSQSDLRTVSQIDLKADGVAGQIVTAHPKPLPDGKTLVNFSRSLPGGGFHVYLQDAETLKRKQIAFIRDADPLAPSWVHDLACTGRHAVIFETPLLFNMPSLMFGGEREYVFMDWRPEMGTRVHVVALDGSGVKTYTAPPFFTFHHINGFEEGGCLHVDFAGYEGPEIMNDLLLTSLSAFPGKDVSPSFVQRMTIPLDLPPGSALPKPRNIMRDDGAYGNFCEFPGINPQFRYKPYRYAYCLAAARPTNMGNALAKHDLQQGGTYSQLWHEPGGMAGEPHFVPRPGAVEEDDGVLLSLVMGADGRSFLLVLDASSWTELARAQLPFGVPYRFHAAFIPGQAQCLLEAGGVHAAASTRH